MFKSTIGENLISNVITFKIQINMKYSINNFSFVLKLLLLQNTFIILPNCSLLLNSTRT